MLVLEIFLIKTNRLVSLQQIFDQIIHKIHSKIL